MHNGLNAFEIEEVKKQAREKLGECRKTNDIIEKAHEGEIEIYWYDYVIAFIWCVVVFLFCFRSPLYWKLGKKEGYPFTPRSAFVLERKLIS